MKKAKRNYNGSEFKISEGAYERLRNMYLEIEKRTPESNGITHIFEDYRGLGTMEVIENEVYEFLASSHLLFSFHLSPLFFLIQIHTGIWLG